jgi:MFS transporter, SHS family, lactate transporter
MQAGVQGAWGVIPVHLNELAADAARGLMPGLAYQMGILLASPTNSIEYALRDHMGYQRALAGFEIVTIVTLAVLLWFGSEEHGRSFLRGDNSG